MSKIMAVNAGSSSIKFQLLEMPAEEVIASGVMVYLRVFSLLSILRMVKR